MILNLSQRRFLGDMQGGVEISILIAAVAFSILLAGGFFAGRQSNQPAAICCDSGDGATCKPQIPSNNNFHFNSNGTPGDYYLLKSNVVLSATGARLKLVGSWNGHPIVANVSNLASDCPNNPGGYDQLADWRSGSPSCDNIPDDELLYLCMQNCQSHGGSGSNADNYHYGDGTTVYDVYYRKQDFATYGIPDVVANCEAAINPNDDTQLSQIIQNQMGGITITSAPKKSSIELQPFTPAVKITQWLRPY